MRTRLNVTSFSQNPRFEYVLDTLCEWYRWDWSYLDSDIGALKLSYGIDKTLDYAFAISDVFPISKIGNEKCQADWGEFYGIPNPCNADPIAGIFYLLSCAEEYNTKEKDSHNRILATELSLVKRGYAGIPLADRLMEVLAKALWNAAGRQGAPQMVKDVGYSSLDIDQVYAVQHKSLFKKLGNLGRQLLAADVNGFRAVGRALLGREDPFDQFEWLKEAHEARSLTPFVFLLMGYENVRDPAWNSQSTLWGPFLKKLKDWTVIGLHPSYRASSDGELLSSEKQSLELLLDKSVEISRQHYLKVEWPLTYRNLINSGVQQDFTLAWHDWLGFRMGTARSCFWFDLRLNKKTDLRLYPPTVMEITGRKYLGLSPKQFLEACTKLHAEALKSNSGLRIIWHNSNLSDLGGWSEWKKVYVHILNLLCD